MSGVLVLNAGYEPLHRVTMNHAIKMLVRNVAVVEESVDGRNFGPFPMPKVLRLVRYVALRWRHKVPSWSRSRLLERDGHRCAYCASKAATVDHVIPVSRGGETTWLNTVAACFKCNNKKGNRTAEIAGMPLLSEPFIPNWWQVSINR